MITVVLDTNVIVSAILSDRGPPARVLELWRREVIELVTCEEILEEVSRVLKTPRIAKLLKLPDHEIDQLVEFLKSGSRCVVCRFKSDIEIEDPDDRVFVECAVSARAQFIITGDQHLLKLREYNQIRIVSPGEFLDSVLEP